MPEAPVSEAELEALAAFDTPTICNALELVAPERRALGFTTETLICPFPALPPIVGYARTALIRSALPSGLSAAEQRAARLEYYRYVAAGVAFLRLHRKVVASLPLPERGSLDPVHAA